MFIEPPQVYFILKNSKQVLRIFQKFDIWNYLNKSSFFDLVIFDIEES